MGKRVWNGRGKRSAHPGYRRRLHEARGAATFAVKKEAAGAIEGWLRSLLRQGEAPR